MKLLRYFTTTEKIIWCVSVVCIIAAFVLFDRQNRLNLISSLVGVTYIIINAKGNPLGQVLGLVFCVGYGLISLGFGYYGETVTYLGMTAPMAVWSLISWLRHPFKGNRAEVEVNTLKPGKIVLAFVLSGVVTVVFYFILKALNTANLIPSTLSVFTSFLAVFLTACRSEWFSLAYAANDIVLIVLWGLAAAENPSYISLVVCFSMFLLNDVYAFISWRRLRKKQSGSV